MTLMSSTLFPSTLQNMLLLLQLSVPSHPFDDDDGVGDGDGDDDDDGKAVVNANDDR